VSAALAPALAALAALSAVTGVRALAVRPRAARAGGDRRGPRHPAWRRLARRVERAGLPVGPGGFAALTAAAALVAGGLAALALRRPEVAVIGAGAVLAGARALLRSADRRYVERVAAQLPGVAQHLSGALGAGLSLRQALTRAAADAPEPVAGELGRVARELALGARVEEALEGLQARLPDPDLRVMVTAILVQRRAGGDLARALGDLAGRLEERGRLARELRGTTAQARATAWMVAGLPVAGAVLVEIASPGTLARTLGQGPGLAVLLAALALQGLGVALVARIARVVP
jgi:tight adherence protein B